MIEMSDDNDRWQDDEIDDGDNWFLTMIIDGDNDKCCGEYGFCTFEEKIWKLGMYFIKYKNFNGL